jgi:hypothetical protein
MNKPEIESIIRELAGPRVDERRPPSTTKALEALLAQASPDRLRVYPDEAEVLREICGRIDAELDTAKAWQLVQRVDDTGVFDEPKEYRELHLAIGHNLLASTQAYVNLKTGKSASGITIDVNGRTILATTAHSISAQPAGHLSFVGKEHSSLDGNTTTIPRSGRDNDKDVAFLELDREWVDQKLGKVVIPLARLNPCGTGHAGAWTMVCGYPTEEIQVEQLVRDRVEIKKFTVVCHANKVLNPDQWSVLSAADRRPSEHRDIFIPFPRNDEVISYGAVTADRLPEPFGMSGGGYWQRDPQRTGAVWTAEEYRLIAIQSRWWGRGRYLQGTQIIHWLRLLWNSEPDLRKALETAFPGQHLAD